MSSVHPWSQHILALTDSDGETEGEHDRSYLIMTTSHISGRDRVRRRQAVTCIIDSDNDVIYSIYDTLLYLW